MKKRLTIVVTLISIWCFVKSANAQSGELHPVKWSFTAVPLNDKEAKIIFTANLQDGWHIYSQFMDEGGPMPTIFSFITDRSFCLTGKVEEESTAIKEYDSIFMIPIVWYKKTAVFTQRVKLNAPKATIKGKIQFMSCNGMMCLPPNDVEFVVEAKTTQSNNKDPKGR